MQWKTSFDHTCRGIPSNWNQQSRRLGLTLQSINQTAEEENHWNRGDQVPNAGILHQTRVSPKTCNDSNAALPHAHNVWRIHSPISSIVTPERAPVPLKESHTSCFNLEDIDDGTLTTCLEPSLTTRTTLHKFHDSIIGLSYTTNPSCIQIPGLLPSRRMP